MTLFAPWRIEVPMQSFPVSPPPITMTLRPLAERYLSSSRFELRSEDVFSSAERSQVSKGAKRIARTGRTKELHGKVDAVEVPVGQLEVARPGSSGGDDDGVVLLADLGGVVRDSDWREGSQQLPERGVHSTKNAPWALVMSSTPSSLMRSRRR